MSSVRDSQSNLSAKQTSSGRFAGGRVLAIRRTWSIRFESLNATCAPDSAVILRSAMAVDPQFDISQNPVTQDILTVHSSTYPWQARPATGGFAFRK
jgi:hypothetical protein